MTFKRALPLVELWHDDMVGCAVDDVRVLLVRLGDTVYAYEDRCAHLRVRLSEGSLRGNVITCAAHHYSYDAHTGKGINPRSVCLRAFPVHIIGDDVHIDVTAAKESS